MVPVTTLAERFNAWLNPARRKFLHGLIAFAAAVAVIWGASADLVNVWLALALAVGGLVSGIVASIAARRADMTWLYGLAATANAALLGLRLYDPAMAQRIDMTLAALVTLVAGLAWTRTDTTTQLGNPAPEQ